MIETANMNSFEDNQKQHKVFVNSDLFFSEMKLLSTAYKLTPETQEKVTSMFDMTCGNSFQGSMLPEICLSFWGFPATKAAWISLQKFITIVLRPRFFMTSTTRSSEVQMMMVIACDRLKNGRQHKLWESWLEKFLECFCMSAGVLVFSDFMGEQMLTCMQRIHDGTNLSWNMGKHNNRDLERLWNVLKRQRAANLLTDGVTNMPYTPANFLRLFQDRQQLLEFAQIAYLELKQERVHMLELAHNVAALERLGNLNLNGAEKSYYHCGMTPVMETGVLKFVTNRDTVATRKPSCIESDLYAMITCSEE